MSELAFNANGESFEVPATVTGWRVRRMKPRGAPELVYGRDGRPLVIAVESDMEDLRDAVGAVGKYRLDPINDDGKTIDSVPAAYVHVVKPERIEPTSTTLAPSHASDDTVREAMRMNTELAKTVIDRFPEMMQAAAVLLRAADGAGLPSREPRATDESEETDGEAIWRPRSSRAPATRWSWRRSARGRERRFGRASVMVASRAARASATRSNARAMDPGAATRSRS